MVDSQRKSEDAGEEWLRYVLIKWKDWGEGENTGNIEKGRERKKYLQEKKGRRKVNGRERVREIFLRKKEGSTKTGKYFLGKKKRKKEFMKKCVYVRRRECVKDSFKSDKG